MISEENRERALRGEKVLLGTYTCSRCGKPIEHWYNLERWCRSTKHTSRCGPDDYERHARFSQGRDEDAHAAEDALIGKYQRIHAESPARKAAEAARRAEEAASASQYLAEAKARLDAHMRCRSMAETIFALDHRVKPAEAMERARLFVDHFDAGARVLEEQHAYAEAAAAAAKARTE